VVIVVRGAAERGHHRTDKRIRLVAGRLRRLEDARFRRGQDVGIVTKRQRNGRGGEAGFFGERTDRRQGHAAEKQRS
jgi:hypothetical protein